MAVLLKRKATLQGAIETTYGTPQAVSNMDAILCSNPTFSADPNVLERDFTSDTLSPQAHIIGRMMTKVEFETELRSNGKATGNAADAPIIARLFQACGYDIDAQIAPSILGPYQADDGAQVNFTSVGNTATNTEMVDYTVVITTGGANPMAQVISTVPGESEAPKAFVSGTPFALGTKGATITPTFTAGTLVSGQEFQVWLVPVGILLKPVSDAQKSITLVVYEDRIKHTVPGCFGSFEITATAGQFATVKWTFWGLYMAPLTASLPAVVYERSLPAQVELSRLAIDNFGAIVEKFSFNQQNDVNVRPDVNSAQGYIGTRITGRKPTGGIDPEVDLVESHDFWTKLSGAVRMNFQMRVGTKKGNTVWMVAPSVQYTGLTYQDRSGIMTYDAGLKFSRVYGNDEFIIALI